MRQAVKKGKKNVTADGLKVNFVGRFRMYILKICNGKI